MKKQWLVVTLLVASLAALAFLNGLGGEFVLDDRAFLINNPQLTATHTLAYFFSENLWYYSNVPDAYSASYRPVFFFTLWLSKQLSLANPLPLHLFSLLLHVAVVLLLLLMIRQLVTGISPMAAGAGAGLFAVHPVHAEAVAWVGAFVHPMATIFLLTAYLAHNSSRRGAGLRMTFLATALFAIALLSNEMAVAFPLMILLSDRIRFGRLNLAKNFHYLTLLGAYLLIRKQVLGESVPLTLPDTNLWLRMPAFMLEYLRHLLIPWPLPLYLQMPGDWGWSIGSIIVVVLFFFATWMWLRKTPTEDLRVPLLALTWIAVFLLPPLAAAFSPDARFALRSLYLPSVGIALFLAWAVQTTPSLRQTTGIVLLSTVFLLATVGTVVANRHWIDDGAVYGQVITSNPDHYAGYLGRGKFYERHGDVRNALINFEAAVLRASQIEKPEPLESLARLLGESGNNTRSLEKFKQLIKLNPGSAAAWVGVGNNLWALNQLEAAVDAYKQAHYIDPEDKIACYNLVLVLNQLGLTDEATVYKSCAKQPG